MVDNAIHCMDKSHYPVDNTIGFPNTYPLDSDLSGGLRYPAFEQLGPACSVVTLFRYIWWEIQVTVVDLSISD